MSTGGDMDRLAIGLSVVGAADSAYLTVNSLFPQVEIVCPSGGIVNCGLVTSSEYSKLFHIVPVALLGLIWFLVALVLFTLRPSGHAYALILLWVASLVMVGYLVFVEVDILHAICLYCTLAHGCTLLLGYPILKLALREI